MWGLAGIVVKADDSCAEGPWFNSQRGKVSDRGTKNKQVPARNEKEGGKDIVM